MLSAFENLKKKMLLCPVADTSVASKLEMFRAKAIQVEFGLNITYDSFVFTACNLDLLLSRTIYRKNILVKSKSCVISFS